MDTSKTLAVKLAKIQKELKAPKSQVNNMGSFSFNYRSCEDILEAVKPLLGDLVLTIGDKVVKVGDRYYIKATAELWDGEYSIRATAYAREAEERKTMDPAQVTGAASSYARKYALNGLFAIDDTKDADDKDNTKTKRSSTKAGSHQEHIKVQKEWEGTDSNTSPKLSERQLGKIGVLGNKDLGWSNIKLTAVAKKLYKVRFLTELTGAQASDYIDKLIKQVEKVESAEAPIETFDGELPLGKEPEKEPEKVDSICETKGCKNKVTKGVASKSMDKYKKVLCMTCQLKKKGKKE